MSANFPKVITKPARVRLKLKNSKITAKLSSPVIIKGNNVHLYHRLNQTYNKHVPLKLISAAWHKSSKNGDQFSILPHKPNKSALRKFESFESFGLSIKLLEALRKNAFRYPTEIQSLSFLPILSHNSHTAIFASTGSGKTLAYVLPVLQSLEENSNEKIGARNPRCVILVPTNELCNQVHDVCRQFDNVFQSVYVYPSMTPLEVARVKNEINHIAIGTPQGIFYAVRKGLLRLNECRFLIVDETDTLLDSSFYPYIQKILPKVVYADVSQRMFCQLVLCSATLPKNLDSILESYTGSDSTHLQVVEGSSIECIMAHVRHDFYRLAPSKVLLAVRQLLSERVRKTGSVLIFCNSQFSVRKLSFFLSNEGFKHEAVYGDVDNHYRKNVVRLLRDGFVKVLISTDVISRGFDTSNVTHVINYECPVHLSDYIYRAG